MPSTGEGAYLGPDKRKRGVWRWSVQVTDASCVLTLYVRDSARTESTQVGLCHRHEEYVYLGFDQKGWRRSATGADEASRVVDLARCLSGCEREKHDPSTGEYMS